MWLKQLHHKKNIKRLLQEIQEIVITANNASTLDEAMQTCLDSVCSFTGWPVGHAYLTNSSGRLIPSKLWHIDGSIHRFETFIKVTETTSFDTGVGLPGRVMEKGEPAWIKDVTKDSNFPRAKLLEKDIDIKAGFAFPVLEGKKVAAVLEFFSQEAEEPDKTLLEALSNLAILLGLVTERKSAETAQKQFSKRFVELQEKERKRIASELHDNLAQNMIVINNEVQRNIINSTKDEKDLDSYRRISLIALQSLKKIKEIAYNLRPAELDALGFKKTIEWMSKIISESSGINIYAKVDLNDVSIPKEVEIQMYRIIQEGINNIIKHSSASEGIIELKCVNGNLSLLVKDDGNGFENHGKNNQTTIQGGFGLQGIVERVKIFNGSLNIDSSLGKGTQIKISIPIGNNSSSQ